MSKPVALLTCERLPFLYEADQALIPLFAEHGMAAKPVIWNASDIQWQDYAGLIIRNTWDYYTQSEKFREWLAQVEAAGVSLFNPVSVVRDNMHKFYLKRFKEKGVTIIPTLFSAVEAPVRYDELVSKNWDRIVIKPAISAGSYQTQVFEVAALPEEKLQQILKGNDWLIQPYLPEIVSAGELSLIFFNGKFSHAIVKRPKEGDFRVQRQYGGQYKLFTPPDALLDTAYRIATLEHNLLYARVDGVMIDNTFHLMELELIEPDLYFEFDEAIRQRFVDSAVEALQR
jgi:glutathione synthase/RimK-type ligase-like ATP-grasp enzyme